MTEHAYDSLVVYTTIIGDGYVLPPVPDRETGVFVCLTDQTDLDANGWEIRRVSPIFSADPVRSSRFPKMLAHKFFPDFARSIYIDSSVLLTATSQDLWDLMFEGGDGCEVAFMHHSTRDTLEEEFAACSAKFLEHPDVLGEHLETIRRLDPDLLSQRPLWGGIVARRHMRTEVIDAMEAWFLLVCRYSRRDQLSLLSALKCFPDLQVNVVLQDINLSPVHRWPIHGYGRPLRYAELADERFPISRERIRESALAVTSLSKERDALEAERDWWFIQYHRERQGRRMGPTFALSAQVGPLRGRVRLLRLLRRTAKRLERVTRPERRPSVISAALRKTWHRLEVLLWEAKERWLNQSSPR